MSSSTPRVAVVITCHNYGRYLSDAVGSVLRQTHPPAEIVVVDDGSTDDTPAVVVSFGDRVAYLRQPQGGANSARNRGLRHVGSASHVIFLDADDMLEPDYISACLQALAADPEASYAYTQMARFGDECEVSNYPEWSLAELLRKNFIHIAALIPIDVARRFPFDESLQIGSMDWDRFLSMAAGGHKGVLVDRPLLLYRRHEASIQRGLRRAPHRRHLLAARLAWKHRRLYGAHLPRQVVFHLRKATSSLTRLQIRRARRVLVRLNKSIRQTVKSRGGCPRDRRRR